MLLLYTKPSRKTRTQNGNNFITPRFFCFPIVSSTLELLVVYIWSHVKIQEDFFRIKPWHSQCLRMNMARFQGFNHYWPSWKVTMYIFPPHKSSLPKYHNVHCVNLHELLCSVWLSVAALQSSCVRYLLACVPLVSVMESSRLWRLLQPVNGNLMGPFYRHT